MDLSNISITLLDMGITSKHWVDNHTKIYEIQSHDVIDFGQIQTEIIKMRLSFDYYGAKIVWNFEPHKRTSKCYSAKQLDTFTSINELLTHFFVSQRHQIPNTVWEKIFTGKLQKYSAYTDGSCNNITRKGGAAYIILQDSNIVKEKCKAFIQTSSNRMEMLAIISAVNSVPIGSEITVYSDSQYAINVFLGDWKARVNLDLIERFEECSSGKVVKLKWVKGHNGNEYNERVDQLANSCYQSLN